MSQLDSVRVSLAAWHCERQPGPALSAASARPGAGPGARTVTGPAYAGRLRCTAAVSEWHTVTVAPSDRATLGRPPGQTRRRGGPGPRR
eukprot:504086-Hanusia_phi.AAC.1